MTISQALISGVVQGITEFFPISSSGHLVLLHSLFGLKEEQLAFDIFLHLGTLASVLIFFHREIADLLFRDRRMMRLILCAALPTFVIALLLKDIAKNLFGSPLAVGLFLVITGAYLIFSDLIGRRLSKRGESRALNGGSAFIIGLAQGVSVMPGISRSGTTIGTALLMGIEKTKAITFSFLLSIPVICGASLVEAKDISGNIMNSGSFVYFAGAIAAMLTGILAIKVLFSIMKRDLFYLFGVYCILAGISVVIFCKGA